MSGTFTNDEPESYVEPYPALIPSHFMVGAYPNGPDYSEYATQFDAITQLWGVAPQLGVVYIYYADPQANWISDANYYAGLLAGGVGKNCIPVIGFPLFSTNGADGTSDAQLQAWPTGSGDSIITGALAAYAAQGFKTQYWRLGWEMNLQGTPYYAILSSDSGAYWIAAFQHIATVMRQYAAANGITLKIIWNPGATSWSNAGNTQSVFWPGASYVDIIGLDLYNQLWPQQSATNLYWDVTSQTQVSLTQWMENPANRENAWMYPGATEWSNGLNSNAWGLADTVALAQANNLPICLPETGVMGLATTDTTGVPDDSTMPYWLENTLATIQANDGVTVDFICIWDAGNGTWSIPASVSGNPYPIPNTQAAYAAAFNVNMVGRNGVSPPPLPPPAPPAPPVFFNQNPLSMTASMTGDITYEGAMSATVSGEILGFGGGTFTGTMTGTFTPYKVPALGVDGFASSCNNANGTDSTAMTLTTANANDVILVFIEGNSGTPSVSDTAGLTWTLRVNQPSSYSGGFLAEFWAVADAPLTTTITASLGSAGWVSAMAMGICGANPNAPFDTNASLPAASSDAAVSVSTTAANTIVIGAYRGNPYNPAAPGAPWTSYNNIANAPYLLDVEQVVTAPQTALAVPAGTFTTVNGGIADAIAAA